MAHIGEDPCGIPNNLAPYITGVLAGKYPHVNIFGNDYNTVDGTGVRDYIHVVDLAAGHAAAINWLNSNFGVGTFNLGTGSGVSVLEMIEAFREVSGKDIPVEFVGRREGDVATCFANPSKAAEELDWYAKLGLTDMCLSAWNWQKKCGL